VRRYGHLPTFTAVVPALRADDALHALPGAGDLAMTVYLASPVRDQLDRAQRDIDDHLAIGADGRCLACGEFEPCAIRVTASAVFARYGVLPRRRPGRALPGLRPRVRVLFLEDR